MGGETVSRHSLGVIGLAVVVALLIVLTGHSSLQFWAALAIVTLLGVIFPPVGFVLLGLIALYLIMTRGQAALSHVSSWVSSLHGTVTAPKPKGAVKGG